MNKKNQTGHSRVIKFRAWNKDKNMMIDEIDMIDWRTGNYWIGKVLSLNYHLENSILMQFTGLKDKNGVLIYEGDVVRCTSSPYSQIKYRIYIVEYWNAGFRLSCVDNFKRAIYKDTVNYSEVIGNIYENPELLKTND